MVTHRFENLRTPMGEVFTFDGPEMPLETLLQIERDASDAADKLLCLLADEPAVIGGGCLLEPVDGLFPGEEQFDGYWDDEIDRQFHYEVKGG